MWEKTMRKDGGIRSISLHIVSSMGHAWYSRFRQRAKNRKAARSISDGVTGIFHWLNPSGRIMVLESTQPVTEMSIRDISLGVEAAGT